MYIQDILPRFLFRIPALLALSAGALLAADLTFSLSFDGKTLVAERAVGSKTPPKSLVTTVENFVPGWNGKDAFLATGPENLLFPADRNIPWPEGTVSFRFMPVSWPLDKPARLLHFYGPGKNPKEYVIFFFYKPKGSEDLITRIYTASDSGKDYVVLTIPGDSIKKQAWQRYDLAWSPEGARLYLDGALVAQKEMATNYRVLAEAPRGWSSLMVLPVIPSEGDDWAVKTGLDDLEIRRGALTGPEIQALVAGQAANPAPKIHADAVILANGEASLQFAEAAGGFACTGIAAPGGSRERFVAPRVDKAPLFQVEFQRPQGDESLFLDSLSDGEKSASISTNAKGDREARFFFRGKLPDDPGRVEVVAKVALGATGAESRWTIDVKCDSKAWGLWSVKYPMLKAVAPPGEADLMLPTGNWGGTLYRKRALDKSVAYPSTDCPVPFISWTRGASTLYLGAHDPLAWGKTFSVTRDHDFELQTLVEDMGQPGKARVNPSPVVIHVGAGDWWAAAKRYRAWALAEAPWTRRGPMEKSRSSLGHFYEVGPWLIFGWRDVTNARDMLLKAQDAFKMPVGFHWYVWHESAFDYNYPELVPKAGFAEAVKAMDARGNLTMPYINGHLWDEALASWPTMKPWSSKKKNGEVIEEHWGTPKHALATMCPATKAYQDALVDYVGNLVKTSGIRCLYIDQIGAHRPDRCFDAGHGHPLGSGSWWMEGYRQMLSRIRAANPGLALTTENTQEIYMDNMEGFLTWNGTFSEDVPVLPAVYSGYASYFASTSDQKDDLDAFVAAQSRAILWGVQPGWLGAWIFEKPEKQADKIAHLASLSRLRVTAGKFLIYGELIAELAPLHAQPLLTTAHHYKSPVAGQPHDVSLPAVMGTLWKASDGTLGVFLANLTGERRHFDARIDLASRVPGAGGKTFQIRRLVDGNLEAERLSKGPDLTLSEVLEPREVRYLEVSAISPEAILAKAPAVVEGSERLRMAQRRRVYGALASLGLSLECSGSLSVLIGGESLQGELAFRNAAAASRSVRVTLPDGKSATATLGAGAAQSVPITFAPGASSGEGLYAYEIRLEVDAGGRKESLALPMDALRRDPVEIAVVGKTRLVSGIRGDLAVRIRNQSKRGLSVWADLLAPSNMTSAPTGVRSIELQAGGETELSWSLLAPQQGKASEAYALLKMMSPLGAQERRIPVEIQKARPEAIAARMNRPPSIDGDLAEWTAPPIALGGPLSNTVKISKDYKGAQDLSARAWLGWDESALYFAVEVLDDILDQRETGEKLWSGDHIQIALREGLNLGAGWDNREVEVGLAKTSQGDLAYHYGLKRPLAAAKLAILRRGDRTVYEAAIPWSDLGLGARAGAKVLSWSFAISENDGDKFRGWLEWTPGIFGSKNSGAFGILRLAP